MAPKLFSPREYYLLERNADYKSDFYEGGVFARAGVTARHSLITSNVIGAVGNQLKGTPCVVYESSLRLAALATSLRTYPNASVYCGLMKPDEEDPWQETYTNPTVLFEVLSASNEPYVRGLKFASYRNVPTVEACVFIFEHAQCVQVFERQNNNNWLLREAHELNASLDIAAINVHLALKDVYDRVDFEAE